MSLNNWSKIGISVGAVFALGSFFRYYVMPVYNQGEVVETTLISTVAIGLLIMAVSWLYNKQRMQGNTIEAIENYIADKTFNKSVK